MHSRAIGGTPTESFIPNPNGISQQEVQTDAGSPRQVELLEPRHARVLSPGTRPLLARAELQVHLSVKALEHTQVPSFFPSPISEKRDASWACQRVGAVEVELCAQHGDAQHVGRLMRAARAHAAVVGEKNLTGAWPPRKRDGIWDARSSFSCVSLEYLGNRFQSPEFHRSMVFWTARVRVRALLDRP